MKIELSLKTPDTKKMKEQAHENMKKVLFRAMVKMESIAKTKAPVNTGNLRARIHLTPTDPGAKEYTLSDGVDYGIHVEYGTKPHHVPIEPLKVWAKKVLGDENAAYAVRHKIALKGTNAQPFFRPALHEVQYKWLPRIKEQVFDE